MFAEFKLQRGDQPAQAWPEGLPDLPSTPAAGSEVWLEGFSRQQNCVPRRRSSCPHPSPSPVRRVCVPEAGRGPSLPDLLPNLPSLLFRDQLPLAAP